MCGRKKVGGQNFINFDRGHVLRTKPEEKGNIVPMCTPCNNWAQAKDLDFVEHIILLKRSKAHLSLGSKYSLWHEIMRDSPKECKPEELDSNHPLYILYTSGTTGNPLSLIHI